MSFPALSSPSSVARRRSQAIFESIESRTFLSVTPSFVEVPISAAAKTADSALNNYKTYNLKVTVGTGDDWSSGDLKATLSSGNFYTPSSSNSNSSQSALWSFKANIEFDTFVTSPNFASPTILGGFNPSGGTSTFNSNTINVSWGDLRSSGAGTFTIARLTISNGAVGS